MYLHIQQQLPGEVQTLSPSRSYTPLEIKTLLSVLVLNVYFHSQQGSSSFDIRTANQTADSGPLLC